jgi:hypothetical protein
MEISHKVPEFTETGTREWQLQNVVVNWVSLCLFYFGMHQ